MVKPNFRIVKDDCIFELFAKGKSRKPIIRVDVSAEIGEDGALVMYLDTRGEENTDGPYPLRVYINDDDKPAYGNPEINMHP